MLTLTILTISLGCVSAVDIDDNSTTATIADDSQINAIKENNYNLNDDSLSLDNEDTMESITPTVVIIDSVNSEEINNISKGTTIHLNVQSTAEYNYHYDSKVATLYVNGNSIKSTNLLPFNGNDNDRRGTFDYTFTEDGTYEVKVLTDPYSGGGESYSIGTSNIITYIVGEGENPTVPQNNSGNNSNPTNPSDNNGSSDSDENVSTDFVIRDQFKPTQSIIEVTASEIYSPSIQYYLKRPDDTVMVPEISAYVNDVHPSGAGIYEESSIIYDSYANFGNSINFTQSGTYKVKLVYKTTGFLWISGMELTSNVITYKVTISNQTPQNPTNDSGNNGGETPTNNTGNESGEVPSNNTGNESGETPSDNTDENSSSSSDLTFKIRDAANPTSSVIEITAVDTYIPSIQYNIAEPEGFYAMPTIDVYVNDVHPAGAGIYVDDYIKYGSFTSLGNCFNFTESGNYVVKLVYKTESILNIQGVDITSNSITYKITIINETENDTNSSNNSTEPVKPVENNTGNNTNPETPTNDTTGNNTNPETPGDNSTSGNNTEPVKPVENNTDSETPGDNITSGSISSNAAVNGNNATITFTAPKDATGNITISLDGSDMATIPVNDGNAIFELSNLSSGNHNVIVTYSGDSKNPAVALTNVIFISGKTPLNRKETVIIVNSTFTRVANDYFAGERGDFFYAVLQDIDGNPLVNKTVQIAVNGPIYNVTTDDQGRAGLQVNLGNANIYTYALVFKGDDEYNAAPLASSKLTVTLKKTSITAKSISFKSSAKKTISVTLKTTKNPYDGKTYLKSGKKLILKVKGKTYTAKINKKGVAKFTLKLTKKGKYTAKIRFKGDKTYSASSKSIKITIK